MFAILRLTKKTIRNIDFALLFDSSKYFQWEYQLTKNLLWRPYKKNCNSGRIPIYVVIVRVYNAEFIIFENWFIIHDNLEYNNNVSDHIKLLFNAYLIIYDNLKTSRNIGNVSKNVDNNNNRQTMFDSLFNLRLFIVANRKCRKCQELLVVVISQVLIAKICDGFTLYYYRYSI